jgi:hypothetical protein
LVCGITIVQVGNIGSLGSKPLDTAKSGELNYPTELSKRSDVINSLYGITKSQTNRKQRKV